MIGKISDVNLEGCISTSTSSREKIHSAAKIWMSHRDNVLQKLIEIDAIWIIYANDKEYRYGTKENIPEPEEIEKLSRETGMDYFLYIHHSCTTEVELTPILKKKWEDVNWWEEKGQLFFKEEEHIGKYVGIRNKQILIFDKPEDVIKEMKTKGLPFFKKYERKDAICIPSYDIIY